MKCDELKYENLGDMMPFYPRSTLVIRKQFVDAAIAELKAMVTTDNSAVIARLEAENAELKEKLESVKTTAYTESVDAGMENRRMKRALWLARSRRAFAEARYNNQIARRYEDRNEKTIAECYDKEVAKWKNSDRKCRAKAEQYL